IENNTLYGGNGMYLRNPVLVTNRNNIVWATGSGNVAIWLESAPASPEIFASDYNALYYTGDAALGATNSSRDICSALPDWTNAMALDLHSINVDPRFVDINATDFHLQSPAGSYHAGTWQGDTLYSPCVDAGDPWCVFTNETYYNGLTINQGCYGNTPEASRTVYSGPFFAVSLTTNPVKAGSAQVWPTAASCPTNGQYPTNRLITVWATVTNQGYLWAGWSGSLTNMDTQAVFCATGTMSVVATFTSKVYSITATGYAGGNISPSGTVSVLWGSNTAFSVSNNTGYAISNIVVDSVSKGATNSWTFTNVTANHSIEAWFQSSSPTITATAGPGGSISPSGSVTVVWGTDKMFAISNNTGYAISNVVVDSVSKGATNSWTFTNVTANHSIEAWFKPGLTTNGTPLSWLQAYGYTGDIAVADWSDEDMDKSYAWQEYQAGTVPTNSQSVFKVLRLVRTPASNLVSWYATTNSGVRTFMTVYRSTNLRYSSWIPWASNIARSFSGTNDWWDTNPPAASIPVFYRPSLTNQAW
ncbi:MAG: hypothetical protein WCP86_00340, partial [bacterium]